MDTPNCRECGALETRTGAEPVCRSQVDHPGDAICPVQYSLPAFIRGRNQARAEMREQRRRAVWDRQKGKAEAAGR